MNAPEKLFHVTVILRLRYGDHEEHPFTDNSPQPILICRNALNEKSHR